MHEFVIFLKVLLALSCYAAVGTLLLSPVVFFILWCAFRVNAWVNEDELRYKYYEDRKPDVDDT